MANPFDSLDMTPPPVPIRQQVDSLGTRYASLFTNASGKIGKHLVACSEVIGEIRHDETQHIISAGEWSAEHVICHVAEQIGPCHLQFSTWSARSAAVHRLVMAAEAGWIKSIRAVCDWRVQFRRPDMLAILKRACDTDLRLVSCHAKVFLLFNDDYRVAIVSSANLTLNPTIEAYIITEGAAVFAFHKAWQDALISNGHPFDAKAPEKKPKISMSPERTSADETAEDPDRLMFLIRGAEGSGRRFAARALAPGFYFGLDPTKRHPEVHCKRAAEKVAQREVARIAIFAPLDTPADLAVYFEMAEQYGYSVSVIECQNDLISNEMAQAEIKQ